MKKISILAFAATAAFTAFAVEPNEQIMQWASNYYAYPYTTAPAPVQTPPPNGYKPFHIEHYGRHGSRWHIGAGMYKTPVTLLEVAERNGKLTPRGAEVLAQLKEIELQSRGRDGELTPLGAVQHRGIAKRMIANFPEVFADGSHVDARSTVVIRCILSMDNELQELLAVNPKLNITSDASNADMYYMNFTNADTVARNAAKLADKELKEFHKNHKPSYDYINKLVNDPQFAKDSINVDGLFWYLTKLSENAQSHYGMPAFYDLFTAEDLKQSWMNDNAGWFVSMGNSKLTDNLGPFSQRRLLRNMITSSDTAIASTRPGANLRFGHEVCVLPLAVLMELDHYGDEINDLEEVADKWKNYEIFPMASNIQMIYFRPDGSTDPEDVLVKVLLNEREVKLPVATSTAPYYRWTDLRNYYLKKLERVPD
ncbi:MAG: histidine phosphatase family protein [Paramuribaculum sp.]|nr:histidine phosphatase family protein [Paramuribaculum sp.]